jgi:hypothetical protein
MGRYRLTAEKDRDRPSLQTSRSALNLVSSTRYNTRDEASETIDTAGIVAHAGRDDGI